MFSIREQNVLRCLVFCVKRVYTQFMFKNEPSYRTLLRDELADRCRRNPAYSMRAFAMQAGLQVSHLSGVLSGSKNISRERSLTVAKNLGLTPEKSEKFYLLVELENARSPELKQAIESRLTQQTGQTAVQELSLEIFKLVSHWYHIPILEMTNLEEFEFSAEAVSRELKISVIEAEAAIDRLIRLQLLQCDGKTYRKTHQNSVFKSGVPNDALKQFHRQMLEKASAALFEQAPSSRYVGSQTFAMDSGDLEKASALIERFRRELVELVDQGKHKDQTFHFGVQLFSLTPQLEKKKKSAKNVSETPGRFRNEVGKKKGERK
jgi:uncharacterized protein (TIGR02147 family)